MPILVRTMEYRACSASRQSSDTLRGALGGGEGTADLSPGGEVKLCGGHLPWGGCNLRGRPHRVQKIAASRGITICFRRKKLMKSAFSSREISTSGKNSVANLAETKRSSEHTSEEVHRRKKSWACKRKKKQRHWKKFFFVYIWHPGTASLFKTHEWSFLFGRNYADAWAPTGIQWIHLQTTLILFIVNCIADDINAL